VAGTDDIAVGYASKSPWVPRPAQFSRWSAAALAVRPARLAARPVDLSIRIVGLVRSRRLNARYRGKDKATNVLSFAGAGLGPDGRLNLGELVICAPVVAREAAAQRKSRESHWAHMTVHGVLHLLGFDHERGADARKMEGREVQILDRLGFSNPYV
jgi:probable rRNA maturation factor